MGNGFKSGVLVGAVRVARGGAKGDGCVALWMRLVGAAGAMWRRCGRVDCYRVAIWGRRGCRKSSHFFVTRIAFNCDGESQYNRRGEYLVFLQANSKSSPTEFYYGNYSIAAYTVILAF